MKLVAAVAIALAAAACGPRGAAVPSSAAAVAPDAAPPCLEIREKRVSFGTKFDDELPQVVLVLANTGGRTLHVEHIDTNCGCARVGEKPSAIEPGASAEVKIQLKLDGMSGPLVRTMAVHTDDPAHPVVHATMEGEVRPRLVAEPARIRLEPASASSEAAVDIDVKSGDGSPLDGMTAFSATQGLTVSATVSGGTARVHVAAAPFAEDFLGSVVLRLGKYERILPVVAVSARDVRASPEKLEAGVVRGALTLQTRLVARKGLSWRVVSVETNRKDVTAQFSAGMLRVRIDETAPAGALAGRVTVVLDGAKPDRIDVPVTAFVER